MICRRVNQHKKMSKARAISGLYSFVLEVFISITETYTILIFEEKELTVNMEDLNLTNKQSVIGRSLAPQVNANASGGAGGQAITLSYTDNYSSLMLVNTFLLNLANTSSMEQTGESMTIGRCNRAPSPCCNPPWKRRRNIAMRFFLQSECVGKLTINR